MRLTVAAFVKVAAVFALICVNSVCAASQGETDASRRNNERDLEERVLNLRLLRADKSNARPNKAQPSLAQVQEDFTRLQVVDNALAEAADSKGALDLRFVASSTAEIETLAKRLMTNLTESKSTGKRKTEIDTPIEAGRLKDSLADLDKLVIEFTHNPVFKEASPDDAKLGAKALSDLDKIISLSGRTRLSAENALKGPDR